MIAASDATPGMHVTIPPFVTTPTLVEYATTELGFGRADGTDTTTITLYADGAFIDINLDPTYLVQDHPRA